ncbi:MAG TPA: maleylpyruvate isomerase family mycothiol-dependent enzyme [Acidimicrobiales bacterium]|nr:maleylpyruvate isomerase family mycothiol-dependent enzyme [Acidimicrobiales bacterium]
MQIVPRYDGPPIVTLQGGADVGQPFIRQRRRLQALLGSLSDDEWSAGSRCEGWTVQDVAAHLVGVNRFWHFSISAGLAGSATRVLAGFDPKATPAAMVDAVRSAAPAETLAELVESNDALCELVGELNDDQWSMIAEAPAGHLPIRLLVHHGLWDCWVHERDIALPLGLAVAEDADEVLACLRFVAALGPAFSLTSGSATAAALVLETTEPDGCVVVEVTDHVAVHDRPPAEPTVVLRDAAVDLVEALSFRAPLTHAVPADHRWLVVYLGEVFETI